MIRGVHRMTSGQFRKAAQAGAFGERRLELLGGIPFLVSENQEHDLVPVVLDGGEIGRIAVADLLP